MLQEQMNQNAKLQEQLAQLTRTIVELRKELQELRREKASIPEKRRKTQKLETSSSDEDEVPPSRPAKKSPPPALKTTNQDPQRPSTSRDATPPPLEPTEEMPKETKIPAIILRKKERWTAVFLMLRNRRINYGKARLINDGISISPATVADYWKITAIFNSSGEEYHTYTLAEDRQLRVVIRGLPTGITNQEIQEDLREQGFPEAKVQRMTSRRTRQTMPLVLIQVPQDQTKILEVKRCCSLVVCVERQRIQHHTTL